MLHTPVLPELAWKGPLGKRWPQILQRMEKVPAGDYPTASLPRDAAHGAWLYRDNVLPGSAARAATPMRTARSS